MDSHGFLNEFVHRFWTPEQPWLILGGYLLWGLLRHVLSAGSQYVLKQTITFFSLCLLGELGAAAMYGLGWTTVAAGLLELSVFGLGVGLIRFAGLLLFRVLMPVLKLETPRILEDITVFIAYGVWAMVRIRYAGVEVSHIFATSAVITAVVAFAMQDTIGNILGGLAIHLDHSVEIGDWIVIDGVSGRVVDIRWRYTKIATRNGEKVVVPNGHVMKNKFSVVGVYGGPKGQTVAWRRWVWFNVDLAHPPHHVIALVERAVLNANIVHVAHNPVPNCLLMEFGHGYARYAMRYWLTDAQFDDPTDSEVRIHLYAALQRADIALAIPAEARHLIRSSSDHDDALVTRELQRRIDMLSHVDLFSTLSEVEKKILAAHLVHAPFVRGEVITRQGDYADWLYLIISGEVEVWLESGAEKRLLATLLRGNVFGEMGLMAGEPRGATVMAKSDCECYRLDKAGLEAIIRARPSIADEISRIYVARTAELDQVRLDLDELTQAKRRLSHHESVLERIRNYFGIKPPDRHGV